MHTLPSTGSPIVDPAKTSPAAAVQFVGNWRLISYTITNQGCPVQNLLLGDAPVGYLMYDDSGHMAVQIMRSDHLPSVASKTLSAASDGYVAYFGTYTIDEQAQTVTHHLEGAIYISDLGSFQVRQYAFDGNFLTLAAPAISPDENAYAVRWQRVGFTSPHR